MKHAILLLLAVFQIIFIDPSVSTLPGFRLELSEKGLDYASTVAHTALGEELKTLKIPNQSGHDGHIDWSLTSIQNRGVTIPGSKMAFAPATNGLTWQMSNLGIDLHSDWRVKYKKGWFKVSTSGSVDLNVKRVSLQVTIRLAVQSGGRPSLSLTSCSASIGDVDVHFHGGTAFILNMFSGIIGDKVKTLMRDEICKVVTKEVNTDANKKLSELKVNVEMDNRFLLDYSLVSAPTIHSDSLETQHKGEVFWETDVKEAPFAPGPIPPNKDKSRMLYLWVTDYVAKSFLYTAQEHKFLQYNVTENDFPASNKSIMNTTCRIFCVGKLIPKIGTLYPNSTIEARVISHKTPNLDVTTKGISTDGDISVDLFAHTPKNKTFYLVSLRVGISFGLKGSVVKERLSGSITHHSVKVRVVKSAIGDINPNVINFILNTALDIGIIPKLNAIMKRGVDLPVTDVVTFQNTKLTEANGYILIATDLTANLRTDQQQSDDLTFVSEKKSASP